MWRFDRRGSGDCSPVIGPLSAEAGLERGVLSLLVKEHQMGVFREGFE